MTFAPDLHLTHTKSVAIFSDDRCYRYLLTQRWGPGPLLGLIGLNPSTLRERWFRSFAKSRGFAGYTAGNLNALVSVDPHHLGEPADPVGPDDDAFIDRMAASHDMIVFAWGESADPGRARTVAGRVWRQCSQRGGTVAVLGWTTNEQPVPPLHPRFNPALQTMTAGTHPDLFEIDQRWTQLLGGTEDLIDVPVRPAACRSSA